MWSYSHDRIQSTWFVGLAGSKLDSPTTFNIFKLNAHRYRDLQNMW